jgi:hypothetical protein
MCEKCRELDQKIEHCNQFIRRGFDSLTMERIQNLIAGLEQQKKTLHECAIPDRTETEAAGPMHP